MTLFVAASGSESAKNLIAILRLFFAAALLVSLIACSDDSSIDPAQSGRTKPMEQQLAFAVPDAGVISREDQINPEINKVNALANTAKGKGADNTYSSLSGVASDLKQALISANTNDGSKVNDHIEAAEIKIKEARESLSDASPPSRVAELAELLKAASESIRIVEAATESLLSENSGDVFREDPSAPLTSTTGLAPSGTKIAQEPKPEIWDNVLPWVAAGLSVLATLLASVALMRIGSLSRRSDEMHGRISNVDSRVRNLQAELNTFSDRTDNNLREIKIARIEQREQKVPRQDDQLLQQGSTARTSERQSMSQPKTGPSRIANLEADLNAVLQTEGKVRSAPYREVLERYGSIFNVVKDPETGGFRLERFSETGLSLVCAITMNGEDLVALAPSPFFASKFSANFKPEMDTKPKISEFFDTQADGTGQIKLVGCGVAARHQGGTLAILRKGKVSGFV